MSKKELLKLATQVNTDWLEEQLNWCVCKIEKNMERYKDLFPSACTTDGTYRIKSNDDWTNGFWTGMLWLSYEFTKSEKFKSRALANVESFEKRLDEHFILDHHDIGFLYSLSTFAGYQILGDQKCKELTIRAADVLANRYQEKGEFIQAWGPLGDKNEYRLIIDSLMNLPLLFEATKLTGQNKYATLAKKHYVTVLKYAIRKDATTYHTYFFNPQTGKPSHGATHQGNKDNSIWARGQSWAILGMALNENLLENHNYPQIYQDIVDVFLNNLPKDLVPYWDFDFTDDNPSDKDSSSLAIVACGLLESGNAYKDSEELAKGILVRLQADYTSKDLETNEGLLLHGVYAHKEGKGIDESNLWGDYFYFEALMRLYKKDWKKYW